MICQKELFSLPENIHYLNCGYKAPLLKSSEEAAVKALIRDRNPANISPADYFNQTQEVKQIFSELVNAKASQIAIIPSTTYGFSSALKNVRPKTNGYAIVVHNEFPSGYFSIETWCKDNDNILNVIKPADNDAGQSWNDNLVNAINSSTSVVLISSIHWMNGLRFDLERIGKRCKEVGAIFIVDGTQSVGVIEMDVKRFHINVLVCAAYKWLLGPYSIGLAYFDEYFNDGSPLEESWINRSNAANFSLLTNYESNYFPDAGRYSVGETSNFILMPMLLASLKQVRDWQPVNIEKYAQRLIQPLLSKLRDFNIPVIETPYLSYHLSAFQLPANADYELFKAELLSNNIYVSVRGEFIRVSVNVFNDDDDIQQLVDVVNNCI